MDKVTERFLSYVKIGSTSNPESTTTPSSESQWTMVRFLEAELKKSGFEDVELDDKGYLMATVPANTDKPNVPVIGFIAHYDTSPDFCGDNINPKIVENYNGGDIVLNQEQNIILSPEVFPELKKYEGQTLITTDGTTLLGADDKAGVAAIITALENIRNDKSFRHGKIRLCFTPDEEIGRGADHFNVEKFGCNYAYTIDGGEIGELEYESFNAAFAAVTIKGQNVHPGYAKHKMINSVWVAHELLSMLPVFERPEFTQDYEGFYHILDFKGEVEQTTIKMIIRDHDKEIFEKRKQFLKKAVEMLNFRYGKEIVSLEMKDQYYNMRSMIEPHYFLVDYAVQAMESCGVKPKVKPIRGGTDGSRLSYMGLPCPNIFAGGHNFHGRFEFLPVKSLEKCVEVIEKLVAIFEERA